jgi:hypothetical protein
MESMKDARYLVRLACPPGIQPAQQALMLARVRERVNPLSGKAINLRVSPLALEFDLFCAPEAPADPFRAALEPVGRVLTWRRLDQVAESIGPEAVVAEARALFNEFRFWEVHEALEALWHSRRGAERALVQGLILASAALVHVQKNEMNVVWRMLEEALRRFENAPDAYYGWDLRRFSAALRAMIFRREIAYFKV